MSQPPNFLLKEPKPVIEQRLYHGTSIPLWRGEVLYSDVQGWSENPRIMLEVEQWHNERGENNVAISEDQLFELMKSTKDVHLQDLRIDICDNGLREPIVLAYDGRLIDGNRRYFAIKWAVERLPMGNPNRMRLEKVKAFVLMENAPEDYVQHVLVEENFSESLKKEWPFFVKARIIKKAYDDSLAGKETDKRKEVAARYGLKQGDVSAMLKIWDLIEDFTGVVTSPKEQGGLELTEMEAQKIAHEKYQLFNEAKALYRPLKENPEFATDFFRHMAQDKFRAWQEVRVAFQAWQDPEARAELEKGGEGAGKNAKAVVDYKSRIVKSTSDVSNRVDDFVKFLEGINAGQMKQMSQEVIGKLDKALVLIRDLTKEAQSKKP